MKKKTSVRIAIAVSRFNEDITKSLLECCVSALKEKGVKAGDITHVWVPGAYELPYITNQLARTKKYDAVITLGCVIKGETSHDLHVSSWAAHGIGRVGLETGVPTLFGVLTPDNEAQARERSRPGPLNRGKEVAEAALEMTALHKSLRQSS